MKDILERIEDSSQNESSHELICRLRDCADEIKKLRASSTESASSTHTESAAPIYAYEWDCGPGVVHRDFRYGTYNDRYPDRTLTLYAASPAAVADETIAAILRLRKNPDKGDEVFRCGYNGAIDAVVAILATTPAPATADAPKRETTEISLYYMRDDHTFKRLKGSVEEMLVQCMEEYDAGFTAGMLCTKRALRNNWWKAVV